MWTQQELLKCTFASYPGQSDSSVHGAQRAGIEPGVVERGTTRFLDFGQCAIDSDAQCGRPRDAAPEQISFRILNAGATARAATVDADEKRSGWRGCCHPATR
jgi:hypothetical protein